MGEWFCKSHKLYKSGSKSGFKIPTRLHFGKAKKGFGGLFGYFIFHFDMEILHFLIRTTLELNHKQEYHLLLILSKWQRIRNWLWPVWSVSMWNLNSKCLQQSCFVSSFCWAHYCAPRKGCPLHARLPTVTLQWAGWPAKVKVKVRSTCDCIRSFIHASWANRRENPFLLPVEELTVLVTHVVKLIFH